MSSAKISRPDNCVAERRVRPIYDWLDSGNNRRALLECEKVLKKDPKCQCARALKCLTLYRLGKQQESLIILEELGKENPTEEATLQAMTLSCREMNELSRICTIYENATKMEPSNEEILTQLFMSYVRISDFKSQQKVAMNLFKRYPKNPYYCWTVMSILLQAIRGEGQNDEKRKAILFQLAERMMDKLIKDNKVEAEQEVQLYMMILEEQNRVEEALKVLDSPLAQKLACTNIPQIKILHLIKLNQWNEVNKLTRSILSENIDRWDIWEFYMQSVFEMIHGGEINNHENSLDNTAEKAHEFICRMVESGGMSDKTGSHLRGPYLARFLLFQHCLKSSLEPLELMGEPISLFLEYFQLFSHKACCVSDLRPFLACLRANERTVLADRLFGQFRTDSDSRQMQRHICALQLARLCSESPISAEELVRLYETGYEMHGKNLLSTDMGPSDNYAVLAVHQLHELALKDITNANQHIFKAHEILKLLLSNSPSNFHAKLLMLKICHLIGNFALAQDMYNSLDVKHLQLDSLGYAHCARLYCAALREMAPPLISNTLYFFKSNRKDGSDHLTFSYKYGSFTKLTEFMDFRNRLENSQHFLTCALDEQFMHLTYDGAACLSDLRPLDVPECTSDAYWDQKLRNNQDLSVNVSWDPEIIECKPEKTDYVRKLFEQDRIYLKSKVFLLECLRKANKIAKNQDSGLESLKVDLEKVKIKEEYEEAKMPQSLVFLPLPSRLHAYVESKGGELVEKMLKYFIHFCEENLDAGEKCIQEEILPKKEQVLKIFTSQIERDFEENLVQSRYDLEVLVNCVEALAVLALICELFTANHSITTKTKKKKQSNDHKMAPLCTLLIDNVKDALEKILGLLDAHINDSSLTKMLSELSVGDNDKCQLWIKEVVTSRLSSAGELRQAVKNKLALVEQLRS